MGLMDGIKERARRGVKRIVLPEGDEPRTARAAEIVRAEGLAEPVLVTPEAIAADAARLERYAAALYELRKAKGVTEEKARSLAAPLPITGAWTGTIGAWVLGLEKKKSILFILLGVIIAGIIVSTVVYTGAGIASIFTKTIEL